MTVKEGELTIYEIDIDRESGKEALLFYVLRRGRRYKAFYLGFPKQRPITEEGESRDEEMDRRLKAGLYSRAVEMKADDVDCLGIIPGESWSNQTILIRLWEKLERLGFYDLPENPFKKGRPPRHINVADFGERFRFFTKKAKEVDEWKEQG